MESDFQDRSVDVGYAVNPLDRLAERREDGEFVAGLLVSASARILLVAGDRAILRHTAERPQPLFTLEEAKSLGPTHEHVLLGRSTAGDLFAVRLDEGILVRDSVAPANPFESSCAAVAGRADLFALDLRTLAAQGLLPPQELGAFAEAKSMLHWHRFNRFCSNCGQATQSAAAGWRRECPSCGAQHFPRTDPVVIMLAVAGDRCLLGRQARFPKGNYSALAGFLEPGETIEAAVRREIREESGIRTGRVDYLMSQPWPFPASLMIGCFAQAQTTEIVLDRQELEDARWFSRDEVREMLAGTHPLGLRAPPPLAIAHHLMAAWITDGA